MNVDIFTAVQSFRAGNFHRAASQFQDVLTEDPEHAVAHAFLSMCLLHQRKPFAAMHEADRALQANPDLPLAHVARGQIAVVLDDLSRAEESIQEALRLDPENTDALSVRCNMALSERDMPALKQAAEVLLQKDPSSAAPHVYLSRAASLALDGQMAERHAREALALSPNDADAHQAIGWAFWADRAYPKAREAGLSALAIAPNSVGAQSLLAAVEMQGRPLTGWLHRIGLVVNQLSMKNATRYLLPALLGYLVLRDLLDFFGYETMDRALHYIFMGTMLFLWWSTVSFGKRAAQNQREARLKRNY